MNTDLLFITKPEFIVSTILALISIVLTFITYLFQRTRKRIIYELVSDALLSSDDQFGGKLKVSFNDEPLDEPHILTLKISNIGNIDLKPSDFVGNKALSFDFKCTKVVTASLREAPDGREVDFEPISNSLMIKPFLLNSGDAILLEIVLTKFLGGIKVISQIAGVKRIARLNRRGQPRPLIFRLVLLFISVTLILMLFNIINSNNPVYSFLLIIISSITIFNLIEVITGVFGLFMRRNQEIN